MSDYSKPPKAVDPENDPYLTGDITEANEKIQHQRECLHMDEEIQPGLMVCKNCGRAVRLDD